MKLTSKLIAATFALTAVTGAFAASDDGNSDNAWLQQASARLPLTAAAAAASSDARPARDYKVIDSSNQIVIP